MNVQELLDGLASGEIDADQIGWQVLDPDGNTIDSGGISFAEMSSDFIERLGG